MVPEMNPYAPPPMVAEVVPAPGGGPQGMWRDGKILVVAQGTPLPPRCIKSNEPTDNQWKRNLTWYPPWIVLTLFIAWPIFLVLVLVLQKKATLRLGLTREWQARRRQRIAIAWGIALAAMAMFVLGIVFVEDYGPAFILLSLVLLLGGVIYGNYAARLVYPHKIDDRFVWLKGVHPDYLRDLPSWPMAR